MLLLEQLQNKYDVLDMFHIGHVGQIVTICCTGLTGCAAGFSRENVPWGTSIQHMSCEQKWEVKNKMSKSQQLDVGPIRLLSFIQKILMSYQTGFATNYVLASKGLIRGQTSLTQAIWKNTSSSFSVPKKISFQPIRAPVP